MSQQDSLNDLRKYISESSVFEESLSQLKNRTEIALLLNHKHECALYYDGNKVQLDDRLAQNADVEFSLSPDAIGLLLNHPANDTAEFGIMVTKLILNGEIKIKILSSSWKILTKGYLKILQVAGPDFMKFLAENGLRNINKIASAIRSLGK